MNKNTLLKGVLAGSLGIFVSKFLGLLYVVPLNYLAQEANISFYSITYTFYGLILNICTAGIPFAIASLVAKYVAADDYSTAYLVKKIGSTLVLALSFFILVFFVVSAGSFARNALGDKATIEDISYLQNSFYILGVAIVTVPFLSALRGYYQGLKEMGIYASSQVVEQLVRVLGIVCLGYLFVKVLHFPSIYAIYMAILSAGLGALLTLFYLKYKTRKIDQEFSVKLKQSPTSNKTSKEILRELLNLGLPFIAASFLSMAAPIINTNYFITYSTEIGLDYDAAKLVLGIFQVNCSKITSIPTVLTLGYSAGLVPYLTEVYEKNDFKQLKKHIYMILNSINYLIVPLSLMMLVLARPVYYLFFGDANLDLGSELLTHTSLLVYIDTVAPVLTSIMITLRLKKETIVLLVIGVVIKFVSFFFLLKHMGYLGIVYSSFLNISFLMLASMLVLKWKYHLRYKTVHLNLLKILFCAFVVCGVYSLMQTIGIRFTYTSRMITMFLLGIYGIVGVLVYLFTSLLVKLPQSVFEKSSREIRTLITRKGVR